MQNRFLANPEPILGSMARLFAAEGAAREVAVLTYSSPEVVETAQDWGISYYTLYLHVSLHLYTQIKTAVSSLEEAILNQVQIFLEKFSGDRLTQVKILPATIEDPQWRDKAAAWLIGSKITNQGRIRSDNVAPLSVDGLLFRSNPEVHLYRALKAVGISFAPLPVFLRGGDKYRRIEPDFVVVHAGITMVIEVDGDTVHEETPAEAHARTSMLQHEGCHVERIRASECDDPAKAKAVADRIVGLINKFRTAK